ncbi:MAG: aldo/keto reductase [Planctomycetota bacterium]|jgi:aryl-alcohol dehydrogenase-like predicted oxidoreductase
MHIQESTRREFISKAVAGTAALAISERLSAKPATKIVGGMPYRRLGKSKEMISLLGVGGFHIGRPEEPIGIRIIHEALDNGATFIDNAWDYHDGLSEERVGKALKGSRRDKAFVMTKHHGRDKKTAMKHLEDSLRRLQTDRIDLWQFHEIVYDKDPDMIFATGGGIEAAEEAKKQGKARYIGFTSHKHPWIQLKMLAYGYGWDAVQVPLNVFDANFDSFQKKVLPVLAKRGIAALAMKTRGGGRILRSQACTVEELWRYVIALPITTVISGMESLELLRDNLRMARELKPMPPEEMEAIRQRTKAVAETGEYELFKTTRMYDSKTGKKLHGIPIEKRK